MPKYKKKIMKVMGGIVVVTIMWMTVLWNRLPFNMVRNQYKEEEKEGEKEEMVMVVIVIIT